MDWVVASCDTACSGTEFDITLSLGREPTQNDIGTYDITIAISRGQMSDQITVTVVVAENTAPRFSAGSYRFTVAEELLIGEQVGEIIAEDPLGEGLEFSIAEQTDQFVLMADSPLEDGSIAVRLFLAPNQTLNYELRTAHRLEIVARNADGEEATVIVVVTVRDVDDLPAFAMADYTFEVPEDQSIEDPIGEPITVGDPLGKGWRLA